MSSSLPRIVWLYRFAQPKNLLYFSLHANPEAIVIVACAVLALLRTCFLLTSRQNILNTAVSKIQSRPPTWTECHGLFQNTKTKGKSIGKTGRLTTSAKSADNGESKKKLNSLAAEHIKHTFYSWSFEYLKESLPSASREGI